MATVAPSILLVEDNPDDEALAIRAFARSGVMHRLLVARDGTAVMSMLQSDESRTIPALILLDLKLPRIDGFEVLRRVRADPGLCCVPVVVLTTSRDSRDIERAYAAGANSYLVKPIEYDRFAELVKCLGSYWLQHNVSLPFGN